jgi:hypothetical protein
MKYHFYALIIFIFLFTSCSLNEEPELTQEDIVSEASTLASSQIFEGQMILGNPINHPYRVSTMQEASNNMRQAEGKPPKDIEASHYYVKFKPKDWVEMEMLTDDTTVMLFTFPLDVEVIQEGGYYHDPSIPKNKPTFHYGVVPIDYDFPDLKYSIKDELYLPDMIVENSHGRIDDQTKDELNKLESIAWKLIGGDDPQAMAKPPVDDDGGGLDGDDGGNTGGFTGSCTYCGNFNGFVTVWDDEVGAQIPVHGVKVRLHRNFYSQDTYTNSAGGWSLYTDKSDLKVTYKWEKNHFSVREGDWFQAQFSGATMNKGQTQRIDLADRSVQAYHAHIFQAAYDYYYGNRFGLTSPPENTFLLPQIKIAAKQVDVADGAGHAAIYNHILNFATQITALRAVSAPYILITRWDDPFDLVYATTAHELGHFAHWKLNNIAFMDLAAGAYILQEEGDERVIESWGEGIEWQFATHRYRNILGQAGYDYENNLQLRTIAGNPVRTAIVVDMIDEENQSLTNINRPVDRVENYTIREIEIGLDGATSWANWRNLMRNRHNDPHETEQFIDELFNNW